MMYVLRVERKDDTLAMVVSEDQGALMERANAMDGPALSWQDFYGTLGAHSNHDDERSYHIYAAEVLPPAS